MKNSQPDQSEQLRKLLTNRMALLQVEDNTAGLTQVDEARIEHYIDEIMQAAQRYALEQRLEEVLLMGKGTGYTVIGYRLWQQRIDKLKQQLAELEEEK